ncbi:PilW family protein [Cerasicoccus maritimus]|uniref:PilW family protein n=1 Tax=Cerasicoccus maritimus TaxID=490089 RepID=UPI0028528842|nr:type II secretion system protein [Cerasicoccus maritimus]
MKKAIYMTASRRGMTLVEIMVSATVLGLLMVGVSQFFIGNFRTSFITEKKLEINRDVRTVTSEMANEARQANSFVLYKSFFKLPEGFIPEGDFRDPPNPYEAVDYRQYADHEGDFVVFIFNGEDDNYYDDTPAPITRIIGYFRDDRDVLGMEAPVRKFDIEIPEENQTNPIETLIPSIEEAEKFSEVIDMVSGLSNGFLFYNVHGKSVLVNGKIIHGNDAKEVTGTYNFTISPRG